MRMRVADQVESVVSRPQVRIGVFRFSREATREKGKRERERESPAPGMSEESFPPARGETGPLFGRLMSALRAGFRFFWASRLSELIASS